MNAEIETTSFSRFLEAQCASHLELLLALKAAVNGTSSDRFYVEVDGQQTRISGRDGGTLILASPKAHKVFGMIVDRMIAQQKALSEYWEDPSSGRARPPMEVAH